MKKKTALSVAGSDSIGGAGIQADIKTMTLNGVYAMSAVTAVTAQNTLGVRSIYEVPARFLADQLDMIFEDIFPDAVKIGMVFSPELAEIIAEKLKKYRAVNIVADPVMFSSSGFPLFLKPNGAEIFAQKLFPMCALVTPNIPEAEFLSKIEIKNRRDMEKAAAAIGEKYSCAALVKGGHSADADDVLYENGGITVFTGKRINNPNSHGTGCTLSSAIAANLAKGKSLREAVACAKKYVSGCLSARLELGKGRGPMDHAFFAEGEFL